MGFTSLRNAAPSPSQPMGKSFGWRRSYRRSRASNVAIRLFTFQSFLLLLAPFLCLFKVKSEISNSEQEASTNVQSYAYPIAGQPGNIPGSTYCFKNESDRGKYRCEQPATRFLHFHLLNTFLIVHFLATDRKEVPRYNRGRGSGGVPPA
jgi:hypothetical protein